jgi:hypothetical protein
MATAVAMNQSLIFRQKSMRVILSRLFAILVFQSRMKNYSLSSVVGLKVLFKRLNQYGMRTREQWKTTRHHRFGIDRITNYEQNHRVQKTRFRHGVTAHIE